MKKQKTIVIKNTRLQKARNNLRIILIKAVSEQSSLILKKCRNKKGNEIGEILRESQNLWHILRRSELGTVFVVLIDFILNGR